MAPRDEDVARWVEDRLARLDPRTQRVTNVAVWCSCANAADSEGPRSRRWIGAALAAGTVVVMAFATPGLRGFAQACGEFVMRTLPGTHSTETYAQTQGRRPFADDDWRDLSGHPIALSAFRGKVVLVTYWTTTCQQCASEMAWFNDFQRRYHERGLEVIGVSVDDSGVAAVKQFVTERPIEYQLVHRDRPTQIRI
jgi:thiol-disulfide isomerase/thioredoxin